MEINLNELKNNWKIEDGRLKLSATLKDFMSCVEKVNQIAALAEQQNHHPDLCISGYKNLEIEIYTHDEHTLTEKDLTLAKSIDQLV